MTSVSDPKENIFTSRAERKCFILSVSPLIMVPIMSICSSASGCRLLYIVCVVRFVKFEFYVLTLKLNVLSVFRVQLVYLFIGLPEISRMYTCKNNRDLILSPRPPPPSRCSAADRSKAVTSGTSCPLVCGKHYVVSGPCLCHCVMLAFVFLVFSGRSSRVCPNTVYLGEWF